jgi:hypothetical protein
MQIDFNLEFGIQKYEISIGNPKANGRSMGLIMRARDRIDVEVSAR